MNYTSWFSQLDWLFWLSGVFCSQLDDTSRFPTRSQPHVLVPTHIFRPSNTGAADGTGGTICSFSTKTWGLWTTRKKRHPISKIPLSGPSCEEFPLFSSSCALPPSLLSSSLLFFFNQAVWGCQVFWDEDSQPCEKLIPCGPSSPWRSSPWELWWWLAGRWWRVGGGGEEEGWIEGRRWRWDEWGATLMNRVVQILSVINSGSHTWIQGPCFACYIPITPTHTNTTLLSSTLHLVCLSR